VGGAAVSQMDWWSMFVRLANDDRFAARVGAAGVLLFLVCLAGIGLNEVFHWWSS